MHCEQCKKEFTPTMKWQQKRSFCDSYCRNNFDFFESQKKPFPGKSRTDFGREQRRYKGTSDEN